jgi:cytochrome c oxidase cbb3-type subunit 3
MEAKAKTIDDTNMLSGHEYDGIMECNYPLPSWWTGLFWVTIIFGIGYLGYYEFAGGPTLSQELFVQFEEIEAMKPAPDPEALKFKPDYFAEIMGNPQKLELGKMVFDAKCASCHEKSGGGGIGPNLTDKYWINGSGEPDFIRETIRDGLKVKGMPMWKTMLNKEQIYATTAWVRSVRNTNVPGGKKAQGDIILD